MIRPVRYRVPAVLLLALGCGHSEPFSTPPPPTVGPPVTTLPRRLTYNPRSDITPSVAGDTLVYARVDADRADGDRCLAFLPLEGGTLYRTACARGALADSVRDSWLFPAVSPDGRRIAFVRERLVYRAGTLLERALVVAPLAAPESATVVVDGYALPGGGFSSGYRWVTWKDDQTLRFVGGVDTTGGGAVGGFGAAGVFEVALDGAAAGDPAPVPELTDAIAYAPGDDGAVYFVTATSSTVFRAAPGTAAEPVAEFSANTAVALIGLTDVAVSDGVVAVIGIFVFEESGPVPELVVANLDGGSGQRIVPLVAAPERLAGVPGSGRVIVESRGDLWLVPIR